MVNCWVRRLLLAKSILVGWTSPRGARTLKISMHLACRSSFLTSPSKKTGTCEPPPWDTLLHHERLFPGSSSAKARPVNSSQETLCTSRRCLLTCFTVE